MVKEGERVLSCLLELGCPCDHATCDMRHCTGRRRCLFGGSGVRSVVRLVVLSGAMGAMRVSKIRMEEEEEEESGLMLRAAVYSVTCASTYDGGYVLGDGKLHGIAPSPSCGCRQRFAARGTSMHGHGRDAETRGSSNRSGCMWWWWRWWCVGWLAGRRWPCTIPTLRYSTCSTLRGGQRRRAMGGQSVGQYMVGLTVRSPKIK
ncbi:hypothetical protein BZA05DRAFT_216278 [Tricharina praecox]|uniref:uncharacterized protein n=1 Tax=Tricharina praecox TaxID=43433 RepID=UPI0022201EBF|nr:uncharacterized protein BZA05DRAFT_216278 [Tricharina praecox]KAI5855715.1 hypothetical protein BZA05DRAFT_216278 [Tricharina praecox]